MMMYDYLCWCLTGVKGCEESNIFEFNFYNMSFGEYDLCFIDWLGIVEINYVLLFVVGFVEICGEIIVQIVVLIGLKVGMFVVGGLFDVVFIVFCVGIEDEFIFNVVMGIWVVISGIICGLCDGEVYLYVYGCYVNDGEFIVYEVSFIFFGNFEWFIVQWGEILFDEINQVVVSLPKAGGDFFFLLFLYGSNVGFEMISGFYGMQVIYICVYLLQVIYEGVVFSYMIYFN